MHIKRMLVDYLTNPGMSKGVRPINYTYHFNFEVTNLHDW